VSLAVGWHRGDWMLAAKPECWRDRGRGRARGGGCPLSPSRVMGWGVGHNRGADKQQEEMKRYYKLEGESDGSEEDEATEERSEADSEDADVKEPDSDGSEGEEEEEEEEEDVGDEAIRRYNAMRGITGGDGDDNSDSSSGSEGEEGEGELEEEEMEQLLYAQTLRGAHGGSSVWDDNEDEEEPFETEATARFALMDVDWERVRAVDLLVVLRSFAPSGGEVRSGSTKDPGRWPEACIKLVLRREHARSAGVFWIGSSLADELR